MHSVSWCFSSQNNTFSGWIDLDHMPQSMKHLKIRNNPELIGTVEAALLPTGLEVLITQSLSLFGTVDFPAMPPRLQQLSMDYCNFHGV